MSDAPSGSETKPAAPANPANTSRRLRIATAPEFFVPYLIAGAIILGLSIQRWGAISIESPPSNGTAGALVVLFTENALGAPATNPWLQPGERPFAEPAEPSLASLKPGSYRIRLGDVVATNARNELDAAIWDERYLIANPSPAPAGKPEKPPAQGAASDPFFQQVGMIAEPPPEQVQKTAPPELFNKLPQQFELAPNKAAIPNLPAQSNLPSPSAPEKSPAPLSPVQTVTTPDVVMSATMIALLKADSRGASTIAIEWPRDSFGNPFEVFLQITNGSAPVAVGLARVWHHLRSVRTIYFPNATPVTVPAGIWAAFVSYLVTPLPFPGGSAFTEPKAIDLDKPPANIADLFNPAFSVSEPVTVLPAMVFVALSVFGFVLGRRRQTVTGTEIDSRVAGAVSVATLFALMFLTRDLWRQAPGSWVATVPGLVFVAVAASAAELWFRAALRAGAAATRTEAGADNALRSVLYRDTPIDDVARDRLGFQVVVGALRRFLDNPDTVPPVVISLNGPWGSGKSSIMKMLASELHKTGRFRAVWFNAWQYHEEAQILPAFLHTIARELSVQRSWGFSLRLAWARIKQFKFHQYLLLTLSAALVIVGVWTLKMRPDLLTGLALAKWWSLPPGSDWGDALSKRIGLVVAIVGLAGGAWTMLSAFRLRFASLFAVGDGARAALIDDFTREFKTYRDAVGQGKFLIVVDDLDRCPPDKVVAVLKAINLIVTSSDETNRSFFVLGFDPDYIVRAIEQHFRSLAPAGFEHEDRFAQEYLKKMVTLSVPKPRPERMREMLARIDSDSIAAGAVKPTSAMTFWSRIAERVQEIPAWAWRLAAAATCAALIAIILIGRIAPHSIVSPPTLEMSGASAPSRGGTGVTEIEMPKIVQAVGRPNAWLWGIPVVMAILVGGLLIRSTRPPLAERAYLREPHDSEEFAKAIDRCFELLPSNPRDLVRTINLMRMEYLLQSSPQAPFSGKPLSEWECVSYTLLQQRRPWMFDSVALEDKVIPDLKTVQPVAKASKFYAKVSIGSNQGSDVGQDIARLEEKMLLERNGAMLSHLVDPAKLQRYADMNRYSANGGYRPEWNWESEPTSQAQASAADSRARKS